MKPKILGLLIFFEISVAEEIIKTSISTERKVPVKLIEGVVDKDRVENYIPGDTLPTFWSKLWSKFWTELRHTIYPVATCGSHSVGYI